MFLSAFFLLLGCFLCERVCVCLCVWFECVIFEIGWECGQLCDSDHASEVQKLFWKVWRKCFNRLWEVREWGSMRCGVCRAAGGVMMMNSCCSYMAMFCFSRVYVASALDSKSSLFWCIHTDLIVCYSNLRYLMMVIKFWRWLGGNLTGNWCDCRAKGGCFCRSYVGFSDRIYVPDILTTRAVPNTGLL